MKKKARTAGNSMTQTRAHDTPSRAASKIAIRRSPR
jgi:hypothetical protein